jgi:hypothetical protein
MKNFLPISVIVVCILALATFFYSTAAVSEVASKSPFSVEQFAPAKDNPALYANYRSKWFRLTGFELSSLHWNQFVAVFINQSPEIYRNNYVEYFRTSQDDWDDNEDEEARVSQFKTYPVGTMVAKEGYTSHQGKPGELTFLVVMKKREKNYDAKNGDWEYMKFAPDGTTLMRGKGSDPQVLAECAGCHINVAYRDYIFATFFSDTASL